MLTVPETRYARCGTINIAYQVFGEGPVDLVLVPGWVTNLDVMWEEPRLAGWLRRLGAFARVLLFDKRGTGLSDRVTDTPTLEERMEDVRAVMQAAGSERAAVMGYSEGGPMCALFAATYPQMALAPAGGVLVSRTVRDLVAGSGLKFEPAGRHRLKGVPEEWELHGVV